MHESGILFSLPPGEDDPLQSDTTGPEDAVTELCADESEDSPKNVVGDDLATDDEAETAEPHPATASRHHVQAIPFATSHAAWHSGWCVARRRSVICGSRPVNFSD